MTLSIPPAPLLTTTEEVARLAEALASEPLIAVDTESNSMYAYREQVCLVQISTRTADYILDPLTGASMEPLGALFADPRLVKVFHAAEYDVMCLKRDYGFTFANLFDTMIAARILGRKSIGLGALLQEAFGLVLDKSHQRDDWGERPLSASRLKYAQLDTHYLPELRDHLQAALAEGGREEEAAEIFADLDSIPAAVAHEFDPEGYWRIALPNRMRGRPVAVLGELYAMRERFAQHRDLPPFKILQDKALTGLARLQPTQLSELESVDGVGHVVTQRYGGAILDAVRHGMHAPIPEPPPRPPPVDPVLIERFTLLKEWRRAKAEARGVESDVIVSKEVLWSLAEVVPRTIEALRTTPGLGAWRLSAYGADLLDVIERFMAIPPPPAE